MKIIYGIDPGVSGGIVKMSLLDDKSYRLDSYNMPEMIADLKFILGTGKAERDEPSYAILEDVHSSRKMGVSNAFTFGQGLGRIEGVLACTPIHVDYVSPVKWQRALNCVTAGDKKISQARAKEIFPNEKITLKTADAFCLAYYGYMKYGK